MSLRSALYPGLVVHQRFRPKAHRLSYKVFCLSIDLDELPQLTGRFGLLGINRPGILSFRERDHGDGGDLKSWVRGRLAAEGLVADGKITVLCYPRMFGYVFNPLTVYYCHDASEALVAILYEVSNTFGERHAYVLPAEPGAQTVRHECDKQFYVSPFMPMECRYKFSMQPPLDEVKVLIDEHDRDGRLLNASFVGRRIELSDRNLASILLRYPLMTLKVMAGIHVEAVRLVLKGIKFIPHPPKDKPGGGNLTRRPHHATRQREQHSIGQ